MLHECYLYMKAFFAQRNWATSFNASNPYCMIIHRDRHSTIEHVCGYNGPQPSDIAAIIPKAEDSTIGRQNIVIRRDT